MSKTRVANKRILLSSNVQIPFFGVLDPVDKGVGREVKGVAPLGWTKSDYLFTKL